MDEMSICAICGKPVPTSIYLDHLDGHRSEEMKNIKPGDWIRLLVNAGPFRTGDVGKVIEVNKGIYRRNKFLCEFDPNEKSVDRVRLDIHEHHCEPADGPAPVETKGIQVGDWIRITAINEHFSNFKVGDLAKVLRVYEGVLFDKKGFFRCDFNHNRKYLGNGIWFVTADCCELVITADGEIPADEPAPVETEDIKIRESPADKPAPVVTIREKALKFNSNLVKKHLTEECIRWEKDWISELIKKADKHTLYDGGSLRLDLTDDEIFHALQHKGGCSIDVADESSPVETIREKTLKVNGEKLADNFEERLWEYMDRVGVREPPNDGSDTLWENLWKVGVGGDSDDGIIYGDLIRFDPIDAETYRVEQHNDDFSIDSDIRWEKAWVPDDIIAGPGKAKKPELTMADIRRDCFPDEYTWYGKQPEKITVDPHPSEDWQGKLAAVMPKDDRDETDHDVVVEDCDAEAIRARAMDLAKQMKTGDHQTRAWSKLVYKELITPSYFKKKWLDYKT